MAAPFFFARFPLRPFLGRFPGHYVAPATRSRARSTRFCKSQNGVTGPMSRKTILTCAVTGNLTTREQHPGLPVTPQEIAEAAIAAGKAGAAVVHIHARDPKTTKGSMDGALFREIVSRIRDAGSDIIINLSTGEGGRFVPSDDEPKLAAPG